MYTTSKHLFIHWNPEKNSFSRTMATDGENVVIKDFDSIDDELGDTHLLRLLSHLVTDTPSSQQGLLFLHQECQKVFSKYPTATENKDTKRKPTPPKRALSQQGRLGNQLKPSDIANRRERPKACFHQIRRNWKSSDCDPTSADDQTSNCHRNEEIVHVIPWKH